MRRCARMAAPVEKDMAGLKRVAKYLRGVPRVPVLFVWQENPSTIQTYTDSDWAGCKATRRSVSGGASMHGRHLIKTWAKKQSVIATSSAEAELYAASRGGSEGLGMRQYLLDLGWQAEVQIHIDSSSALSFTARTGLVKAKHIGIQHL